MLREMPIHTTTLQVSLIDVESGVVMVTETFDELTESRNKAAYAISPDGSKVRMSGGLGVGDV